MEKFNKNKENDKMEKIGILTGGGDCPGLNPVIRAVVRKGLLEGYEIVGIKDGWKGLIENSTMPLNIDSISGILHRGGTILGTPGLSLQKRRWKAKTLSGCFSGCGRRDILGG